jgi:hypothetical protein
MSRAMRSESFLFKVVTSAVIISRIVFAILLSFLFILLQQNPCRGEA